MKTITKTSYHNMYHRYTKLYDLKINRYHFYSWNGKSEFLLIQDFSYRLQKIFQVEL